MKQKWISANASTRKALNRKVNELNIRLQRLQREAGRSFVSRTTLRRTSTEKTVVLRCVIMNPMTTIAILKEILHEQEAIYATLVPERLKQFY